MTTSRTLLLAAATALITALLTLALILRFGSLREATSAPAISLESATLTETEAAVIQVVSKAEPAVVSVIVSKDVPVMERFYEESPFGFRMPRLRQRGTEELEVGGGTAFFVSEEGLLMTNKHVVSDPEAQYTVFLNDGRRLAATVVTMDPVNDIALLKVENGHFPFLTFDEADPVLGQTAIAIGNSLGEFRNTVSVGVISGLQRSIMAGNPGSGMIEQLSSILQTDAAINTGNSGGPLLNSRGLVMGMNTATASIGQNISFAIPASDLRRALESYEEHGRIVQPYMGVRYVPITPAVQEEFNVSVDYGVLVTSGDNQNEPAVIPGSPAERAGIRAGDIILEADGQKLTLDTPLSAVIQRKSPGDTLQLRMLSGGRERTINVTLEELRQ